MHAPLTFHIVDAWMLQLSNVSMQRGGSSVDTWVMTEGAVDASTMLREHLGPDDLIARSRTVSSRAAENLFWLGRYTERAANSARLARAALERLSAEADDDSAAQLHLLDVLCRENHMIPADTPPAPQAPREFERALSAALTKSDDGITSVAFSLQGMCATATAIRERLSYRAGQPYHAASEFTFASTYVARHVDLARYAAPSFTPGRALVQAAWELMQRIHEGFAYASDSTEVPTTALDALAMRRGVCQDFAHVLIGALAAPPVFLDTDLG